MKDNNIVTRNKTISLAHNQTVMLPFKVVEQYNIIW